MKALISNLINNSVESYPPGGGFVKVVSHNDSDFCTFRVIDEGMGISPEIMNQIGKATITHGKEYGKGVGLLHAYRVVSEWGGRISINSPPGGGTQVTIVLPRKIEQRE